jgi:MoaA/NifB/PqqE/SkfB family radical SAM enzyme
MPLALSILYRGPLSSCNYDCHYCPFAKRHETAFELAVDRDALARFCEWIAGRTADRLSVFFTPWGEALIRRWYQEAAARLTNLPQIAKVAFQTNLSCDLDWIDCCDVTKLGLWCTFHPTETCRLEFLERCHALDRRKVQYSVGSVGLKEHFQEIERLREELAPHVYVWINAFKQEHDYYTPDDLYRLEAIDPLFRLNTEYHASLGRSCRSGTTVVSVDGAGTLYRCHFVKEPIGNLYEPDFERQLFDRPCPNATCGCHIGYVHLDHLGLYDVFGDGVLERVPARIPSVPSFRPS